MQDTNRQKNIREAYSFVATNYEPGDEIVLLGFSRGAFTARGVAVRALHLVKMYIYSNGLMCLVPDRRGGAAQCRGDGDALSYLQGCGELGESGLQGQVPYKTVSK